MNRILLLSSFFMLPSLTQAAASPDTLRYALSLIYTSSSQTAFYDLGEPVTIWKKRSTTAQSHLSGERKVHGVLEEIHADSILIGEDWISLGMISHITRPGKGSRKHVIRTHVILILVSMLGSILLVTGLFLTPGFLTFGMSDFLLGVLRIFLIPFILSISYYPRVKTGDQVKLISTPYSAQPD